MTFFCSLSVMMMSERPQGSERVRSGRGPPFLRLKRARDHVVHGGPFTEAWKKPRRTSCSKPSLTFSCVTSMERSTAMSTEKTSTMRPLPSARVRIHHSTSSLRRKPEKRWSTRKDRLDRGHAAGVAVEGGAVLSQRSCMSWSSSSAQIDSSISA